MKLRHATAADADFLLGLRNDPATRANSRRADATDPKTHAAWLSRTLGNPCTTLYVLESESGQPLGTGRLDFDGSAVEINLTVAPDVRGKGVGQHLLTCLVDHARRDGRATRATALVALHNIPSLRAFLSNGFVPNTPTVRLELPFDAERWP